MVVWVGVVTGSVQRQPASPPRETSDGSEREDAVMAPQGLPMMSPLYFISIANQFQAFSLSFVVIIAAVCRCREFGMCSQGAGGQNGVFWGRYIPGATRGPSLPLCVLP